MDHVKPEELMSLKPPEPQHSGRTIADIDANEDSESVLNRKLMLFGRDVSQIPCFRNSFLYGILSGFGTGVATFAFTSNIPKATSFGFYSYVAITAVYYFQCNYQYSKTKFEYEQIKYAMRMNAMYEGTEKGMKREKPNANLNVQDSPFKI
jgi:cytochrome c oxidase assembly protein subunit 20